MKEVMVNIWNDFEVWRLMAVEQFKTLRLAAVVYVKPFRRLLYYQ